MASQEFDPFNKRLARDTRNKLSKAFLHALAVKDRTIFQRCGDNYLQQNRGSVYERYVTTRLEKYEKAYAIIKQGKIEEIPAQADIFWELGLYFEMHELLESDWKEASGDRRRALQGLIRAVGMKIHAENKNMKAATSMGIKALADLLKYGGELADFVNLAAIIAETKRILAITQSQTQDC